MLQTMEIIEKYVDPRVETDAFDGKLSETPRKLTPRAFRIRPQP